MNLIDLFAGCGGLSTGFEIAGYSIPLAIEKDAWASETYKKNHPNTKVITEDITQVKELNNLLDNKNITIDGIIGGPPCQGFSLSGNRDKNDPRNSLFMEFVRFVKYFNPKFFVMENVKGILSMKTKNNDNVKDIIKEQFINANYKVEIFILNAAEFGVPQSRERVFFIGYKNSYNFTREDIEPKGFLFGDNQITIEQAIMDLPQIKAREGKEEMEYESGPQNSYQKWVNKSI